MPKVQSESNRVEADLDLAQGSGQGNGSGALTVNPILYQPVAIPLTPLQPQDGKLKSDEPERFIKGKEGTGYVAVLSHSLPEPTSYSGKNLIAIDFGKPASTFLEFDGKGTYVDCGNPEQLNRGDGNSITIEAWVKAETVNGWQQIIAHGQERSKSKDKERMGEVFLRMVDGGWQFGTWDGLKDYGLKGRSELKIGSEDLGAWVHLAGVYNQGDQTYRLYKNGFLLATEKANVAPMALNASWFIGAALDLDPSASRMSRFFKGAIAEVRIWTVARTATEIAANMHETVPASAGQLGALWRLTDGSGSQARDYSLNRSHGTVKGQSEWKRSPRPLNPEGDASVFVERPGQSRVLTFDGKTTYVKCGNPPQLQGRDVASLTIEAWVKIENLEALEQSIVAHGQAPADKSSGPAVFLKIFNGGFEFGSWDGVNATGAGPHQHLPVRNEDLGVWVHVAGVYNATDKTYRLYRNGSALAPARTGDFGPMTLAADWYIGAQRNEDPNARRMDSFFRGQIAEVRVWTMARSEQQIRGSMWESQPSGAPGELGACWRLNDGEGTRAREVRGYHGTIMGTASWNCEPTPLGGVERLARRADDEAVKAALQAAKETGFFDPLVFPLVPPVMSQRERKEAAIAIVGPNGFAKPKAGGTSQAASGAAATSQGASGATTASAVPTGTTTKPDRLEETTFLAFYKRGYNLILRRAFSGETEYDFVPSPPPTVRPQLLLVEEYQLSSFLGSYGVGRVVKTFSLLPGEKTKLTIRTASKTAISTKQSQSILDSYSTESANEFESSLAEEKSKQSSSSDELSYHASVQASGSWGWGSASGEAGFEGSTNSAREEFAKSVSNATAKHAAKASANRNVQIDTTSETTRSLEESNEIVREIENINVGRTLNFVFCQMNQEMITLLHLVDVRIGYTDGIGPVREVALYELPELLESVVNEDYRQDVAATIVREISAIRDYTGNSDLSPMGANATKKGFIVKVGTAGTDHSHRCAVNRDFTSTFIVATEKNKSSGFTVPGVIISAKTIGMRSEDVVVDALIGEGWALDGYAKGLQAEENISKRLANRRAALENHRLALENKRHVLLADLVQKRDAEMLKLYNQAFTPVPTNNTPSRVVSIWDGNSKP